MSVRSRKGFALPMAILAITLMTAGVIAAYSSTSAETVANNAMRAQDRAYQLAQTGLQQFLVERGTSGFCSNCVSNPEAADSEWTRVSLQGGYADVVAMRVRPALSDGTPSLFFVRSHGVDTSIRLSGAGIATHASRIIGQYATFATRGVKGLGAWTSLNGITNSSSSSGGAPVRGADECDEEDDLPGVVVPRGRQYTGSGPQPSGSPRVDSSMTLDSLRKAVGIDWNAIVNNDAIPADLTIPPDAWPSILTWFFYPDYMPVIRITSNNYSLPNMGRGILIADSNITIPSNEVWDGVILVGGRVTMSGSGGSSGLMISGLNRTLPGAINPADGTSSDNDVISSGSTKRFDYNSCRAKDAADKLRVYFGLSNTWTDNVAIW
jgi:hypothetical protein